MPADLGGDSERWRLGAFGLDTIEKLPASCFRDEMSPKQIETLTTVLAIIQVVNPDQGGSLAIPALDLEPDKAFANFAHSVPENANMAGELITVLVTFAALSHSAS